MNKFKITIMLLAILITISSFASAITLEKKPADSSYLGSAKSQEKSLDSLIDSITTKLMNEAAERDHELLMDYLHKNQGGSLYNAFAGDYIDANQHLTICLSDNQAALKELLSIPFETKVQIKQGEGSYFTVMEELDRINAKLTDLYKAVKGECETELEKALASYFPCASYDSLKNQIEVRVVADNEDELKKAIALFSNLFGKKEIIAFKAVNKEANIGTYLSTAVNPGRGAGIENAGKYSLGFRAQYSFDGETHYGIVTAAHGNSIGKRVSLAYPFSIQTCFGIIDRRGIGGSVDAAFVRRTNGNYYFTQNVHYSSYTVPGVLDQTAVLNGTYTTPAYNSLIYKCGDVTQLTKGKVISTCYSTTIDGIYYHSLLAAQGSQETLPMALTGDSGGIAYVIHSGNTAKAAGIVLGLDGTNTVLFTTAYHTLSGLNVDMY